jgi:hypothetical protein
MDDESYHLIKMYDQYAFMKPVSLGYLSLYNFQIENQVSWDGLFLSKKDGSGIEVPNIGFKKRMTEFLSDCGDVSDKIGSGDLGRKELDTIIIKYNECIENRTESLENAPSPTETLTQENTQPWNELESTVRKTENLVGKETILEMIAEAKAKTTKGEKIPNFIVDGLKKSLENQPQLTDLLNRALQESGNK